MRFLLSLIILMGALSPLPPAAPDAACDSVEDCETATQEMCSEGGHGGVDGESVTVTNLANGDKFCSGDCDDGAIATVTCAGGE